MSKVPKHIAIIMDGNGRWAKKRFLPRIAGHVRGVKRAREIVEHCVGLGVSCLTLFAFGRENWKRPEEEVSFLMKLLSEHLAKEFYEFGDKEIQIRFIGDRSRLDKEIIEQIDRLEQHTLHNTKFRLNIAFDYSGMYDITQAVNAILAEQNHNKLRQITEEEFSKYLLTYPDPMPELLVRTGGEMRLSNFMLWQIAYTECYFTNKLWPVFDKNALDVAIKWYGSRERRFGMISEQLQKVN